MSETQKITAWVSKYALTRGIFEVEGEISDEYPSMLSVRGINGWTDYYHGEGRQWHRTLEEAKERGHAMVKNKIESLKKQLKKMQEFVLRVEFLDREEQS